VRALIGQGHHRRLAPLKRPHSDKKLVCSPAEERDMKRSRFTEEQIIGVLQEHHPSLR